MAFDFGSSRTNLNTSSTIGQANGNTYSNNGHVYNVTVAEAQHGADGLSRTRDQQDQQQNPLGGLMALLNPFAMLSMLGGGGGSFLKMG